MSLVDKYRSVVEPAKRWAPKDADVHEENGKLIVRGTTEYQLGKDKIWDEIKKQSGWENEVQADIKVEKSDIYGVWEVQSGDSLSKIAKSVYDDGSQYMRIFEANRGLLKDPDMIQPGQKLTIPNRA